MGSAAYVQAWLGKKRADQDELLDLIPLVPDLQSAWLLLLFCGSTRANYLLRTLPPNATLQYATSHDDAMMKCLSGLLANAEPQQLEELHRRRAQLPLRRGGLGLRSAARTRAAAYWASWADTLPVLQSKWQNTMPEVMHMLDGTIPPLFESIREVQQSVFDLAATGFQVPSWQDIAAGRRPRQDVERELGDFEKGWQRNARCGW